MSKLPLSKGGIIKEPFNFGLSGTNSPLSNGGIIKEPFLTFSKDPLSNAPITKEPFLVVDDLLILASSISVVIDSKSIGLVPTIGSTLTIGSGKIGSLFITCLAIDLFEETIAAPIAAAAIIIGNIDYLLIG